MPDARSPLAARARLTTLLEGLDRAFGPPSWHGPTLGDAIRDLTEDAASWRPAPEAHNAWELIVHADYWTYRVHQHVADGAPSTFSEPGANFFERPANGAELATDIQNLRERHAALRNDASALGPHRLDAPAYSTYTLADVLAGIAAHHVYHAGQIQLLRRLYAEAQGSGVEKTDAS